MQQFTPSPDPSRLREGRSDPDPHRLSSRASRSAFLRSSVPS